jgi:hypothetical protein
MEQYRRRLMFSVVPQERHRFGSFPFETGTGIAFPYSFIISQGILSQLTEETRRLMRLGK